MKMAKTSMSGLRMAVRMICMKAIWTKPTSVVRRVTSELVEKRSMLPNENDWMLWNMSWRRFLARPVEAFAQVMPATVPQASDTSASATRMSE